MFSKKLGVLAAGGLVLAALFGAAIFDGTGANAGAGSVDEVAVDADISGNSASTVGSTESCGTIASSGGTLQVDVVVKNAPSTAGYGLDIEYDEAVVNLTALETPFTGAATFTGLGDPIPDSDGDYRGDGAIFSGYPTGSGALLRLTFTAVGNGTSPLNLTDNIELDGTPNIVAEDSSVMTIGTVSDGSIVVGGGSCGGGPTNTPTQPGTATPTGTPTNTPGPTSPGQTPSPTPTPTEPGTETPTAGPTSPGQTPSPTPTPGTETDTPTPTPTDTGTAQQELAGDTDCDGEVTTRDSQALLRSVLEQNPLSQTEPCPDPGDPITFNGLLVIWGDWDCDGSISTRDNQALLRFILQQNALSQTEPCPNIGTPVNV